VNLSGISLAESTTGAPRPELLPITPDEQRAFIGKVDLLIPPPVPIEMVWSLFRHRFDDPRGPDIPLIILNASNAIYRPSGSDTEEVDCSITGDAHVAAVICYTPIKKTAFNKVVIDEYSAGPGIIPAFTSSLTFENRTGLPIDPFGPPDPEILPRQARKYLLAEYSAHVLAASDTTFTLARLGDIMAKLDQCTADNRIK
jgi:hypothetical protein